MDEEKNNSEPVFNVMPAEGKSSGGLGNSGSPIPPTSASSFGEPSTGGSRKWVYLIIGVIVLAALGAAAYYLLGSKKTEQPVATSRLSKAWLNKYFNVDACADQNTCGETADPDKDGLNNYDEFKEDTNPLNPDSDEDGLADGDEVYIYKTEATLKFTDKRSVVAQNNWTDGYQIKNGFDPLTPGLAFTDTRKQQIATATTQYKLHEPTITTLGNASTSTYVNAQYGFEFTYPSTWKKVTELKASSIDYLSDSGKRTFVAIYPTSYPAPDYSARIDVYPAKLAVVTLNSPFIKGKTSTTKTVNNNTWTMFGSTEYLLERNGMTYSITAEATIANQILSTFKFTK